LDIDDNWAVSTPVAEFPSPTSEPIGFTPQLIVGVSAEAPSEIVDETTNAEAENASSLRSTDANMETLAEHMQQASSPVKMNQPWAPSTPVAEVPSPISVPFALSPEMKIKQPGEAVSDGVEKAKPAGLGSSRVLRPRRGAMAAVAEHMRDALIPVQQPESRRRPRVVHNSAQAQLEHHPMLPVSEPMCENEHLLERVRVSSEIRAVQGDTVCDVCARIIKVGSFTMHCEECIFDMCTSCVRAKRVRNV
jgi:hypothetical protein